MFESLSKLGIRSIVGRLTIWYIVSTFLLVFLATGYLYWSLANTLSVENHAILENRLQTIRNLIKKKPNALQSIKRRIETEWPNWHFEKVFIRIVNEKNELLVESPNIPLEVTQEIFPKAPTMYSNHPFPFGSKVKTKSNHSYVAISETFNSSELSKYNSIIYLVFDLNHEEEILSVYQKQLLFVLFLALLSSVIIGIKISRSGFKPVQDIIETANSIKSTTLHERISETGLPIELQQLASTINEMLDRLKKTFERLSQFSSDIAHELRTPVNNLRGELEVALGKERSNEEYQEILQSSLEESTRLSRIIDSLLFLAQAENPNTQIKKEIISLEKELSNIIEFYEPTAAEEGISVEMSVPAHLVVNAERTLFQRAIGNILSNAINYTPRGGSIKIEASGDEEQVKISITDTGDGISEEHLLKIFDRFYRSDSSRTTTKLGGFGLGLSIVKSILKLHEGSVVIKSKPNQGTQATLTFLKKQDPGLSPNLRSIAIT